MNHEERRSIRKEAADYVSEGHSTREASEKFDRSPRWVRMACKEFDVDITRKPSASVYRIIAILLNTDLSYDEVGEKEEVDTSFVSNVAKNCRAHGIRVLDR